MFESKTLTYERMEKFEMTKNCKTFCSWFFGSATVLL